MSGWGLFDMARLSLAVGAVPVLTVNANAPTTSTADLADLVEYCHGSGDTTWGRQRIEDGQSLCDRAVCVRRRLVSNWLARVRVRSVAAGLVSLWGSLEARATKCLLCWSAALAPAD